MLNEFHEHSRIERPLSLGACNVSGYSGGLEHEENGILPFLLPTVWAMPGSSACSSIDVAGREIVETGLWIWEGAAMADCGLGNWADGRRVLTLLEKELFDAFRMDAPEVCRDDMEDEKEESRATPAIDVALTWGLARRELGAAGAGLPLGSPARSANVFRFRVLVFCGGAIAVVRAFVDEADISDSLPGDKILLGGRKCEGNCHCR